jgi:hypothetical protein
MKLIAHFAVMFRFGVIHDRGQVDRESVYPTFYIQVRPSLTSSRNTRDTPVLTPRKHTSRQLKQVQPYWSEEYSPAAFPPSAAHLRSSAQYDSPSKLGFHGLTGGLKHLVESL